MVLYGDHMDLGDGWWIVMMVGMLLFWSFLVIAVVWAIRAFAADRRHASNPAAAEEPLAVLDRSLAEAKISVEDYERRRQVLTGGAAGEYRSEET